MNINTSYGQVELHLNSNTEFTRRFGARVKACGGRYSACRIIGNPRIVVVPASEQALINEMVAAFPDGKKTALIARKYEDLRVERAPSWVHVHNYPRGHATPATQWLAGQVRSAVAQAVRRKIIQDEPAPVHALESDAEKNPALREELGELRGGIMAQAHRNPLPARFQEQACSDRPAVCITDSTTGRQVTVPLFALGEVRQTLNGLFA
jgi:hypothetical protein